MSVSLPVVYPEIAPYPAISNLYAIIGSRRELKTWLLNYNLQIVAWDNSISEGIPVSFLNIHDRPLFDSCPFIHRQKISKGLFGKTNSNLGYIRFIIEALTDHHYVEIMIDAFYIPSYKIFYQRFHQPHPILIYGYSENHFLIADHFESGKFCFSACTFEELLEAIVNLERDEVGYHSDLDGCIELIRFRDDYHLTCKSFMNIDIEMIRRGLESYLSSSPISYFRGANNHCYGQNVYKLIKENLASLQNSKSFIDLRSIHNVWCHKKIMLQRIQHLIDNKLLAGNDLYYFLSEYSSVEKTSNSHLNLLIKYSITRDSKIIYNISDSIDRLLTLESKILSEVTGALKAKSLMIGEEWSR